MINLLKILKKMINFNRKLFICPDCGKEIVWPGECLECDYEPPNNGQYD